MQTPALNAGGYTNTSVVARAQDFKNGRFMLVHGTGSLLTLS